MIDLLLPFQYEFFIKGIIVSVLLGGVCGLAGVYIILRGLSYVGHGLSHAAFGGAIVGNIAGLNYYVGAIIWSYLASFVIYEISKRNKIKPDAAIGLVTTAIFAFGVLLVSMTNRYTRNFESLLFGNILAITEQDLYIIVSVTILSGAFFFLLHKRLVFSFFDNESAKISGIKTSYIELLFSFVLATIIIVSMSSIGVTLLASVIVGPAISARLLSNNFSNVVFLSIIIGSVASFSGMYASFFLDSSSGPTIVMFITLGFGITALYAVFKKIYHSHSHGGLSHSHPHLHTDEHRHEHEHKHP
ncbi:metal ABC transporter permease [Candidatus Nitrosocosmicus arcticus]|uniref:ABC-type Mn2+ transport system, permease component n=1 Tax=Candidatus Nitrosocosmicus arcticus TaxID=2035267 RepID=A0A557SVD7_9ARCH|nr:metal ABC transporter permease [Candidatus Nitrosocosmicus arcticus]TVP40574.1 ABC-type Mn2+ transport system, permease component [Candidatus Nitrosocosmicus arcticus]